MRRRVIVPLGVLVGYAAISFAYFGWRLVPHPGRMLVGNKTEQDPQIFVWAFAWWPHAILSWTNPFFSHAVYAPGGVDLAWETSVPALAVAFSPFTLLFGPSVSYNLAAIALPALSAFAAYLLFVTLTHSCFAAVVGGYLYGFSSFILSHQLAGHLNLTAAFVPPLIALVLVRFVRGELGARALALWLGLLITLEAYISSEVAVTLTLALAAGLVLAVAFIPGARSRLRAAVVPVIGGYAIAAVLAAPLLYYALSAIVPFSIGYPWLFSADPLNLVVPTSVVGLGGSALHGISSRFPGNMNEQNSYLGVPALVIVVLVTLRRRRKPGVIFLCAAFALATLASFGTALWVHGHRLFWLPWAPLSHLPVLENVIPSRVATYATLAVATLVAIWIASTRGRVFRRPFLLPALAVLAIVPPVWAKTFVQQPARLAFFSDGLYRACIPKGETLLIFPFGRWGNSLLWQAESGFWFNMTEGALGPDNLPLSFTYNTTITALLYGPQNEGYTPPSGSTLLAFAQGNDIGQVVSSVVGSPLDLDPSQMGAFGSVERLGDVYVSPACGAAPIEP